jgi:uncharacterized protein (TIGR00159 family)
MLFSIITIKDIIDILLVALILYGCYRLLRKSGVENLFWGIMAFMAIWFLVCYVFRLELTGTLFNQIMETGALALIVIFHSEIRAFFYKLGAQFHILRWLRKRNEGTKEQVESNIELVSLACTHMANTKTGALIVITQQQDMSEYMSTGETIDAALSTRMIENIFFKNSPLHDGAMFVSGNRIMSAACILPVSHNVNLPQYYGLRHRAALGITEKTDTIAIVVSEETGNISIAYGEKMYPVRKEQLYNEILKLMYQDQV